MQLKTFGPALEQSAKISNQSKKDLLKLINGLGQAGAGSAQLQTGLAAGVLGASQLNGGAGQASGRRRSSRTGLGSRRQGGLGAAGERAQPGAVRRQALKDGAGQALTGASQLASGLGKAYAGQPTRPSPLCRTSSRPRAARGVAGREQR